MAKIDPINFDEMTDYTGNSRISQSNENVVNNSNSNDNNMQTAEALLQAANSMVQVANSIIENGSINQNDMSDAYNNVESQMNTVLNNNPQFKVPYNPLSPPDAAEVLDYNSLQYLNGLLRTQIGVYVKVTALIGSNEFMDYYGFLVGVGTNYIVLQELSTGNITSIDFYSIKTVYYYYAVTPNSVSTFNKKPITKSEDNPANTAGLNYNNATSTNE